MKYSVIQFKALFFSLLISLGTGFLSSILTKNSMASYNALTKPFLTPPSFVFPIVWTILFVLMGISSYLIYVSHSKQRTKALGLYVLQLVLNFSWSILFFNFEWRFVAFLLIILLFLVLVKMIVSFYKINKIAAYLQIPYLLWIVFAGYLNLCIFLLNK
ncbi:MAG: TspO/MBR family protein [Oscillospiraceae bacterium]